MFNFFKKRLGQEVATNTTKTSKSNATKKALTNANNGFFKVAGVVSRFLWNWSLLALRFLIGIALFVVVIFSCLFFTSSGSEFLLNQVKKLDDNIKFDYVSGHFGHGFVLDNVSIVLPEVLTLEASRLELDYNLLSLIGGRFEVRTVNGTDVLLVLGQKPDDMPDLVKFLASRLKEVHSFSYDEERDVMERTQAPIPDPTWEIAPKAWPVAIQSSEALDDAEARDNVANKATSQIENNIENNIVSDVVEASSVSETTSVSNDSSVELASTEVATTSSEASPKETSSKENLSKEASSREATHLYPVMVKRGKRGELAEFKADLYRKTVANGLSYAPTLEDLVKIGGLQSGEPGYHYVDNGNDNKLATLNRSYMAEEANTDNIRLPITIELKNVRVHNFLMLSDVVDVAFADAEISARMSGDTITVTKSHVAYIDVGLHNERFVDDPNAQAPDPELASVPFKGPFNRDSIIRSVGMLPTVILPFDIDVLSLDITGVRYHQDGYETGVMMGKLTGSYKGARIYVEHFAVDHELGHAELNKSEMYLTRYYPMHVFLSGHSHNEEYFGAMATHTLEAEGEGDLVDLFVKAELKGVKPLKDSVQATARIASLTPDLPFVAEAEISRVGFPFTNPDYKADKVKLKARGTLSAMSFDVKGEGIKALNYPTLKLEVSGNTDLQAAEITALKAVSIPGTGATNSHRGDGNTMPDSVSFSGLVSWSDGVVSSGKLDAVVADLRNYLPDVKDMQGSIGLDTEYKVSFFDADDWAADVSRLNGQGTYMRNKFSLSSKHIALNQDFLGEVRDFGLSAGADNTIKLNGVMRDTITFHGDINLGRLEGLWPGLGGKLNGTIDAGGTYTSPRAKVSLKSDRLVYTDTRIRDISLDLNAYTHNMHLSSLDLEAQLGRISVDHDTMVQTANVEFHGSEADHELMAKASTSFGDANLKVTGGLNAARTLYQGKLEALNYSRPELKASLYTGGKFTLDLAKDLVVKTAQMVFKVNDNDIRIGEAFWNGKNASLSVNARAVDLMKYRAFLPSGLEFSRPVSLAADLGLEKGRPQAVVKVNMPKGHILFNRTIVKYETVTAGAVLKDDLLTTDLDLNFGAKGTARSEVTLSNLAGSKDLGGYFKVSDLDLGLVAAFSPDISSSDGVMTGDIRFEGTASHPEIRGGLNIEHMNITTAVDLGTIENINTAMTFMGTKAQILSSFYMKDRKGTADGFVAWEPDVEAQIALKTDRLPVNLMGYGTGEIELDVMSAFKGGKASVSGSVSVPTARIKVRTLPASSVSASSDVIKIEKAGNGTYKIDKQSTLPVNLKLTLNVGPDFNINAMGLKTDIEGSLNVRQKPGSYMTAKGVFNLNNGRFKAYGQNLIIERGRLSFVGDVANPGLEIRAIRDPHAMENENVTVGLQISGTAKAPQIKLFSEPQMAQSEMLSYLMRGRGMDASSEENSDMSTQLLLGVGLMETSGYIGEFAENFGISDFSLDSKGDGDDTAVEVSGYIMPKVQVAYGYGIYNALSEFRVRYEMFPRFFIEYASSLEQAVDALYKFEF